MIEKLLILTNNDDFLDTERGALKRFGVDVLDVVTDESHVPFGELAVRYNILIIDKQFCGNALRTATLVRQIRKEFLNPIIGIELMKGDGELFSLQVAGCNFPLLLSSLHDAARRHQIMSTIEAIGAELPVLESQLTVA